MQRNFRKLTEWVEELLAVGVPDEQRLFAWKQAEKAKAEQESCRSEGEKQAA